MFEPWLTRWSLISEGDPVFTASSRSSRLLKWIIAYTGLSAAWLIEGGASPAR
jgi:streptomycin 6-kinase